METAFVPPSCARAMAIPHSGVAEDERSHLRGREPRQVGGDDRDDGLADDLGHRRSQRLVPGQAAVVEAGNAVELERLGRDDGDRSHVRLFDDGEHVLEQLAHEIRALVGVERLREPRLRAVEPLHGDEHVRIHAAYSHTVLSGVCSVARRPPGRLLATLAAQEGKGRLVTYSPKVFIPLTKLCRDVCHYCTFAAPPRKGERAYMSADEVLDVARAGAAAGCSEALFTLGDKPERRYRAAREELAELGCETTIEYLVRMCRARARGDGPAAAREPGRDDARRARGAARGHGLAGDHARDRVRPAVRARRAALRLARQAPGRAAGDDPARRRAAHPVHDGDPDRHRRDARGADRGAAGDPRRSTSATATSRR